MLAGTIFAAASICLGCIEHAVQQKQRATKDSIHMDLQHITNLREITQESYGKPSESVDFSCKKSTKRQYNRTSLPVWFTCTTKTKRKGRVPQRSRIWGHKFECKLGYITFVTLRSKCRSRGIISNASPSTQLL